MDMKLSKEEMVCPNEGALMDISTVNEDIAIGSIKADNGDMIYQDLDTTYKATFHKVVPVHCIKVEHHNVHHKGILNIKDASDAMVSRLREDIAIKDIKIENDMNHNNPNADVIHREMFVGEDYYSDNNLPLTVMRRSANLSTAGTHEMKSVARCGGSIKREPCDVEVTLELVPYIKGDQSPLGANRTDNVVDIKLAKEEHVCSEEDDTRSVEFCDVAGDGIKTEHDELDRPLDAGRAVDTDTVRASGLHVDVEEGVKCEPNDVASDTVNEVLVDVEGEDHDLNDRLRSVAAQQRAEPGTTQREETRIPNDSVREKRPRRQPAAGGLPATDTLSCDICPYRTNNKSYLSTHAKAHAAAVSYKCDVCSYLTIHRGSLNCHLKSHSSETPFSCDICTKSFIHRSHLTRHLATHSGKELFTCNVCNKTFVHKSHVTRHMTTHADKRLFPCNICNKSFLHRCHLTRHMRTHCGERLFACDSCNKSFSHKSHLIRHMITHSGEKLFACNICNKAFNQNGNLTTHMRIHSGEKLFSCGVCSKAFNQKSHLVRHVATHSGEKLFSCYICNKGFTRKSTLITHLRIHSGEQPFACNVCHKGFVLKYELKRHMRKHSGEGLFSCDVCNKTFNRKCNLVPHLRIHSGEKPFLCDICNKSFTHRSTHITHLRVHSGEVTLTCDVCHIAFNYKRTLVTHLRTHSGKKSLSSKMCSNK